MLIPCVASIFSIVIIILGVGAVSGQDYPNKPIRIITGPVGGGGDFAARQIAQSLTITLGQPVLVENRVGVSQGEVVSKAPPDGHTLFVAGGNVWIVPLLQKAPYDVVRDFTPISLIVRNVNVVAVHTSLPVKNVKELISLAKSRPSALNYASSATGGGSHLAAELFNHMAGVNIVRIAYKGDAAGITALISGEVQVMFTDIGLAAPHAKSGKLRNLAVTSATPTALAPNLPTVAAAALPGYEAIGMQGMFAPAKTPVAIINRINQEIVRMLNQPEVKERFLNAEVETVGSSPEQFGAAVKSDIDKIGKLIKDAGIKVD